MTDKIETPVPLPSAPLIQLVGNATLQPPLTRRGYGPGLIIITSGASNKEEGENSTELVDREKPRILDPLPQKKWAEEGYAVARLDFSSGDEEFEVATALGHALEALTKLETCDVKDRYGLIGKKTVSHYLSCSIRI